MHGWGKKRSDCEGAPTGAIDVNFPFKADIVKNPFLGDTKVFCKVGFNSFEKR